MDVNTVKLNWPFWKNFLLRIFLYSRTPSGKEREDIIKSSIYLFTLVSIFVFWMSLSYDYQLTSVDLKKPSIIFHGYISRDKTRDRSPILINDKRLRLYLVQADFIAWKKEVLSNSIKNPFDNPKKSLVVSGYICCKKKEIIITSLYYDDNSTKDWNNIELVDVEKVIKSIKSAQADTTPAAERFFSTNKFFLGLLVSLMLINSIFIFFDELKLAKFNKDL